MKRYLTMVAAGLLVIGMAAPLFAADVQVTGQVRTRYRYWSNISLDSNNSAGERNYFDVRTRFGADAKLTEGVRARIELEALPSFGQQNPNAATPATLNETPFFRQAWMDFQIPGLPEGWRTQIGRSFFSVGHQYVYGNSLTGDDGITVYGPLGPGTLKLRFGQPGGVAGGTQVNINGFQGVSYEFIDYKFEVAPKQNLEIYGIAGQDRSTNNFTATVDNAGNPAHSNEYWIGGAYDGVVGPVALKVEGTYQGGKARANAAAGGAGYGAAGDVDRSAFFIMGDAEYKIIPEWTVGLNVSYASGDNDATDNDFNNFVSPLALFATSPTRVWTDSGFFFGNRTGRFIGNAATNRAYNFWGRGTEDADSAPSISDSGARMSPGLIEVKVGTSYAFSPKVTGYLDVIPAWAAKNPGSGSYIGTDIDLQVAYKPYPNIVMNGYFGYFITGSFFDSAAAARTSANQVTDNALVFRAEAIVTF